MHVCLIKKNIGRSYIFNCKTLGSYDGLEKENMKVTCIT
jgi:hypothetical protein